MGKLSKKIRRKTKKFRGRVNEFRGEFHFVLFTLFLGVLMMLFQNCSKGFTPRELASLGSNNGAGPTHPPGPPPTGFGLNQRQPLPALPFAQNTSTGGTLAIVQAFPNLSFQNPLFLTHAGDGTDRLFIVEQGGLIKVFNNAPNAPASGVNTFLNISTLLSSTSAEEGLLGLAFDPNYETNGFFYVYYTAPSPLRSVVARYHVSSNPNVADPSSGVPILEFDQPYTNHNGGCLAFGPDGYLYIASGDGGSGGDPENRAQNLTTLLGKILRIDVRTDPYSIPLTNPFATHATNRKEIFAYGLRNPWRISFDRMTGLLWVGDVGQNQTEEVDIVRAGNNMGWKPCEGNHVYGGSAGCPAQYTPAITTYEHDLGQSITGGYVYRGNTVPALTGKYLYGDFVSGRVWALTYNSAGPSTTTQIATFNAGLSSFGEDQAGEVYITGYGDGRIYKFQESGSTVTPMVPARLSETGLFTNAANLTAVPGLITYDVNVPLWSDGALKKRWIGIPGTEQIQFNRDTPWVFPTGTIFVKHFVLPTGGGNSKRVETRIMYNGSLGWAGYTYKWNAAGTDADLVPSTGLTEDITVGTTTQSWRYPARGECMSCHTPVAGRALGLNTHQLNMNFAYPSQLDNQLRAWNHIGLFETNIPAPATLPAYPPWYDLTGNKENLSRAYLAVNCSQCHQPGGTTPTNIDFRYTTPISQTNLVNVPPTAGSLGLTNPARILPGDHASSLVWERMNRTDAFRMPPLGTSKVDSSALSVVQQWINSL